MATVFITALANDASAVVTFNGSYATGGISSSTMQYMDSASPLGSLLALPVGPVTAGQKYRSLYAYTFAGDTSYYIEITQSGTTTTANVLANVHNVEYTNGTAKYVTRKHQGWARANGNTDFLVSTWLHNTYIASTTVWVPPDGSGASLNNWKGAFGYVAHGADFAFSVDKSTQKPDTFLAGAVLSDGLNTDYPQSDLRPPFIRGVTFRPKVSGRTDGLNNSITYNCTIEGNVGRIAGNLSKVSVSDTYKFTGTGTVEWLLNGSSESYQYARVTNPTMTSTASGYATYGAVLAVTDYTPANGTVSNKYDFIGGDFSAFTTIPAVSNVIGTNAQFTYYLDMRIAQGHLTGVKLAAGAEPVTPSIPFRFSNTMLSGASYSVIGVNNTYTGASRYIHQSRTNYRTGGAADGIGGFSTRATLGHRMEFPVNLSFHNSKIDEGFTLTIELLAELSGSGVADLSEEDVWVEVGYPDHTTTWHGAFASTQSRYRRSGLIYSHPTGPVMLTPSSASWLSEPAGCIKRKMALTISPRRVGNIVVRVGLWQCPWTRYRATVDGIAVYIDPLVTLGQAA